MSEEKYKRIKEQLNIARLTVKLILKLIKFSFKASPFTITAIFATMAIFSSFSTVQNFIYSRLLDDVIKTIESNAGIKNILVIGTTYVFIQFLSTLENSISSFLDQYNYLIMQRAVRIKLLDKLSKLDFFYFENAKYQDLINNVKENDYRVYNFSDIIIWFFKYILVLFISLGVILNYSWQLALLVFFFSTPRLISRIVFGKRNYGLWEANAQTRRDYEESQDYLKSEKFLQEIRVYNLTKFLKDRVEKLFDSFLHKQLKLERKRFIFSILADIIAMIGYSMTLYILITDVLSGTISIGLFTFYFTSVGGLLYAIERIISYSSSLFESSLYVNDFFKFLELPEVIKNGDIQLRIDNPPVLEFKNISFKYPNSIQKVFDDFNLRIKSGEKIAIVGENGAGKSTLVKILQRFYDVDSGSILINGVDLKDLDRNSWYKNISVLGQEFNRYHFDAKTNIGIGNLLNMDDIETVKMYAKIVGAHDFIEKYDKKYDQVLSKHYPEGIEPSTGQWQKIALARALLKQSKVLILDEPTSAIDPKSEAEIFEELMNYAKDKTVIIISHRFSTVRNADRIIVLSDGRIKEEGSHAELIAQNGIYKEAYDLQKKGYLD